MDCREIFGVVRFSTFSTLTANSGHSRTDKLSAKTLSVRRLTPSWHSPEALARDSRRDYEAVPNRFRALMRPNAKRSFSFLRVILGALGGRLAS